MRTRFLTVVETPVFLRQADKIRDEAERSALVDYVARNPQAGVLIPDTAECGNCAGDAMAAASVAARG